MKRYLIQNKNSGIRFTMCANNLLELAQKLSTIEPIQVEILDSEEVMYADKEKA